MGGMIVLRRAVLRGMQREAPCDLLVRKQSPGLDSDYAEAFVLSAPPDLPDGDYAVAFDRHMLKANKKLGLWLSSREIVRVSNGTRQLPHLQEARGASR